MLVRDDGTMRCAGGLKLEEESQVGSLRYRALEQAESADELGSATHDLTGEIGQGAGAQRRDQFLKSSRAQLPPSFMLFWMHAI